jgi:hypothetical protein
MNSPLHRAARAHHRRLAAAGLPNRDAHHAVVLGETQHNMTDTVHSCRISNTLPFRLITAISHLPYSTQETSIRNKAQHLLTTTL